MPKPPSCAHLQQCLREAPRVAKLPRDSRGLPIPYVVLRDRQTGRPDFVVNDMMLQLNAAAEGLCNICGLKLTARDTWFLGGPRSAFDPRGMYNDGPMHHECATFALKVCPYLSVGRYAGMKPVARESLMQDIMDRGALGFDDPTMDPEKPQMFVLGRVRGLVIVRVDGSVHVRYAPNRPFEQVEIWTDGKQTAKFDRMTWDMNNVLVQGLKWLEADGLTIFDLQPFQLKAWSNGYEGHWPWPGAEKARDR